MLTDEALEEIKDFLEKFRDVEDLKRRYIDVYQLKNSKVLISLFESLKANADSWNFTKNLYSSESLRIDKLQKKIENYTIKDIINLINAQKLDDYKRIIIELDNADYADLEELEKFNLPILILVNGDKGFCNLDEFKKMRSFLNDFKKNYETYNLSPLEKITLAYDYVKFYYYNKEENNSVGDSRQIAKLISTGNIVCEGYARLFCQLLKELGLKSFLIFNTDHVRVVINVKDEKYNTDGIYVFDPTWDSDLEMAYVQQEDGSECYKIKDAIKKTDTIIERMPSTIRYNYYMIPLYEYCKYFPQDKVGKILRYGTSETIDLAGPVGEAISFNDSKPRNNEVIDLLPQILAKTKKIEGYSSEQIEHFIANALNIMNQDRFGRYDKYNLDFNLNKGQIL